MEKITVEFIMSHKPCEDYPETANAANAAEYEQQVKCLHRIIKRRTAK